MNNTGGAGNVKQTEEQHPATSERTENAVRTLASNELLNKRKRLGLTQAQASVVSGIPYGTYIMAESYGRMGNKVIARVNEWLKRPDAADKNKIATIMRKGHRRG